MRTRQNKTTRRFTPADRLAICVGCAALLAGVLVVALTSGAVASIIGVCLLGLSAVAFVSLAFLLVGESEDRHYGKGAQ